MRNPLTRLASWLHRCRHDDRGIETAEILLWMAVATVAIVLLSGRVFSILDDLVTFVQNNLPGSG